MNSDMHGHTHISWARGDSSRKVKQVSGNGVAGRWLDLEAEIAISSKVKKIGHSQWQRPEAETRRVGWVRWLVKLLCCEEEEEGVLTSVRLKQDGMERVDSKHGRIWGTESEGWQLAPVAFHPIDVLLSYVLPPNCGTRNRSVWCFIWGVVYCCSQNGQEGHIWLSKVLPVVKSCLSLHFFKGCLPLPVNLRIT